MSLLCETPNESFMTSLIYQADNISPEFWRLTVLCRVLGIKDHCTLLKSPSLLSVEELRKWREKLELCSSSDSISFLVAESAEMTVTDWFAVILSFLFDEWEMHELCFSMISVHFRPFFHPLVVPEHFVDETPGGDAFVVAPVVAGRTDVIAESSERGFKLLRR